MELKITITPEALSHLKHYLSTFPDKSMYRFGVKGGGCSGFEYILLPISAKNGDDVVIEEHGLTIVIDPVSILYVNNSEIDWDDSLFPSRLTIRNPNAKGSCGCGQSFEPKRK